jgi:ribosome-binding factor A
MSHRQDQLASEIQRSVQTILGRGLSDPRVRGLISVTKVQLSDDLGQARVYVSVLPAEHGTLTIHGLSHAAPRIRRDIGRGARMKRLPMLSFHLDESIKRQAEIEAALGDVTEEPGS